MHSRTAANSHFREICGILTVIKNLTVIINRKKRFLSFYFSKFGIEFVVKFKTEIIIKNSYIDDAPNSKTAT